MTKRMKTGDHFRQGDVLTKKTAKPRGKLTKLPKSGQKTILAWGEVTGHHHRFEGADTVMYRDGAGNEYVKAVMNDPLVHEEHGAIVHPSGFYEVGAQVQYEPAELMRVAD